MRRCPISHQLQYHDLNACKTRTKQVQKISYSDKSASLLREGSGVSFAESGEAQRSPACPAIFGDGFLETGRVSCAGGNRSEKPKDQNWYTPQTVPMFKSSSSRKLRRKNWYKIIK